MRIIAATFLVSAGLSVTLACHAAETITIATVNNGDMIRMQRLSKIFEAQHPEVKLNWVVLEENVLRQRLTTDISTQSGQFDVLTIGTYETPLWGGKGWLEPMKDLPASYDVEDIFPAIRPAKSSNRLCKTKTWYPVKWSSANQMRNRRGQLSCWINSKLVRVLASAWSCRERTTQLNR